MMGAKIHPTALVHPKAQLADDCEIGAFCVVDQQVKIGAQTVLHPFVRLYDFVEIGEGCEIFENTVLAAPPQDRGFKGEQSWVRIGAYNVLRENVTIHRASGEGQCTQVGDHCLIMEGVHLGHNVQVGSKVTISAKAGLAGHVEVGNNVVIGGLAGFHQFVRIGDFCMIGGASKNTQHIPPFVLTDGSPSRIYGLNVVGLKRNGFSADDRRLIKAVYRVIYSSQFTLREGLAQAQQQFGDQPLAGQILKFFDCSTGSRSFCDWPRGRISKDEN